MAESMIDTGGAMTTNDRTNSNGVKKILNLENDYENTFVGHTNTTPPRGNDRKVSAMSEKVVSSNPNHLCGAVRTSIEHAMSTADITSPRRTDRAKSQSPLSGKEGKERPALMEIESVGVSNLNRKTKELEIAENGGGDTEVAAHNHLVLPKEVEARLDIVGMALDNIITIIKSPTWPEHITNHQTPDGIKAINELIAFNADLVFAWDREGRKYGEEDLLCRKIDQIRPQLRLVRNPRLYKIMVRKLVYLDLEFQQLWNARRYGKDVSDQCPTDDEEEDLESDESMEYIPPTSISGLGDGEQDFAGAIACFTAGNSSRYEPAFPFKIDASLPKPVQSFSDDLKDPQSITKLANGDELLELQHRIENVEKLLLVKISGDEEMKKLMTDIKDAIYGDPSGKHQDVRNAARSRGLLLMAACAEDSATTAKETIFLVHDAVRGQFPGPDKSGAQPPEAKQPAERTDGLMQTLKWVENMVVSTHQLAVLLEEQRKKDSAVLHETKKMLEMERQNSYPLWQANADKCEQEKEVKMLKARLEAALLGNAEAEKNDLAEENARLRMWNGECEKRWEVAVEDRQRLIEKISKVDEMEDSLMELLWPQGKPKSKLDGGHYRRDELLGKEVAVGGVELGRGKPSPGFCSVM